jgi:hypothetical protein
VKFHLIEGPRCAPAPESPDLSLDPDKIKILTGQRILVDLLQVPSRRLSQFDKAQGINMRGGPLLKSRDIAMQRSSRMSSFRARAEDITCPWIKTLEKSC